MAPSSVRVLLAICTVAALAGVSTSSTVSRGKRADDGGPLEAVVEGLSQQVSSFSAHLDTVNVELAALKAKTGWREFLKMKMKIIVINNNNDDNDDDDYNNNNNGDIDNDDDNDNIATITTTTTTTTTIIIIIIKLKSDNRDFYNVLTAPRTVSNTYAQVARVRGDNP